MNFLTTATENKTDEYMKTGLLLCYGRNPFQLQPAEVE